MIDEPTDLTKRMSLHKLGQITWPEPKLRKWCSQCRHFLTKDIKTAGKGRCDLVMLHANGKGQGVAFDGANAIACPKFDQGVHRLNEVKT